MNITTEYRKGKLVVWLYGELDHHATKTVVETLSRELDECLPQTCVLNMESVGFMDSSGIALILRVYKRMRELAGKTVLVGANPQVLRIINMSGLDKLIQTEERAV